MASGLWGYEFVPPPRRVPQWWEALPGMVEAGAQAFGAERERQARREMAMMQMQAQAQRHAADLGERQRYHEGLLGARDRGLDIQEGEQESRRAKAQAAMQAKQEQLNIAPFGDVVSDVPARYRAEPELTPIVSEARAYQRSPFVRRNAMVQMPEAGQQNVEMDDEGKMANSWAPGESASAADVAAMLARQTGPAMGRAEMRLERQKAALRPPRAPQLTPEQKMAQKALSRIEARRLAAQTAQRDPMRQVYMSMLPGMRDQIGNDINTELGNLDREETILRQSFGSDVLGPDLRPAASSGNPPPQSPGVAPSPRGAMMAQRRKELIEQEGKSPEDADALIQQEFPRPR